MSKRDMIRILLIGTAVVTVLYVLINVAYLNVLGLEGLRKSDAVAATVMRTAFGPSRRDRSEPDRDLRRRQHYQRQHIHRRASSITRSDRTCSSSGCASGMSKATTRATRSSRRA